MLYTAIEHQPDFVRVVEGEMMRVLLADDNRKVRFALNVVLQRRPEVVVAGEASDAASLLVIMADAQPDLLLMDWQLPGLDEVGSIPFLRQLYPELMIVALSGRPELGHEALAAGADDFVSKIDPPESLLGAIAACIVRLDERQAAAGVH